MVTAANAEGILSIRLLGRPGLSRDGAELPPPRGAKAWGILAYLVLTGRPVARRQLASLLFAEADDPLGALRWSLAELRRALGAPGALRGDPVVLGLPEGVVVDALLVTSDDLDPDVPVDLLAGELLEGMAFPGGAGFEAWLAVERRRQAGAMTSLLQERARAGLAAGRADAALAAAARAVDLEPLLEVHHELLVRCMAASGDRAGALAQVERCEALWREELGMAPSPAVRRAAYASDAPIRPPAGGRAAALGQLEAGLAAADAGAVETAVERLRRACTEAAACGDGELRAKALVALGTTLVHAIRGRDEEGAAVLHQAIAVADRAGARAEAVAAHRELGFINVQAGHRERAEAWLAQASALAEGDAEIASVRAFQGMNHSDMALYESALVRLGESVERAQAAMERRLAAWSLSLIARIHSLRGEDDEAITTFERTLDLVDAERWTSFRPWPQALLAEVEVRTGALDRAADRLEHAFSLACQVEDPCWEAVSARAIGLLEIRRGRHDDGRRWLDDAVVRATRTPDRYEWTHGYSLDAVVADAVATGEGSALGHAERLHALAARTTMRELVVRAQLHLAHLGVEGALDAARATAAEIENPVLRELAAAG